MFSVLSTTTRRTAAFVRPTTIQSSGVVVQCDQVRHATKKAGGSTSNGRSSQPHHLGVKAGNGTTVVPGTIIVRQRGTSFHAAAGVGVARDHTLFALTKGKVVFRYDVVRQRRVVAVSANESLEAPVAGFSKTETKKRLADLVDAEKYLSLDAPSRLAYVRQLAKDLDAQDKSIKKDLLLQRLSLPGRKPFHSVDLTLL
ncbi:UNVERIFIED_CONTAM: hypothetical protein HDU68_012112 [Siphonaria sp. JEL0065]|nr:hypothetical protein HDU68_012112 [Siphonaria sp. JEL0065]